MRQSPASEDVTFKDLIEFLEPFQQEFASLQPKESGVETADYVPSQVEFSRQIVLVPGQVLNPTKLSLLREIFDLESNTANQLLAIINRSGYLDEGDTKEVSALRECAVREMMYQ